MEFQQCVVLYKPDFHTSYSICFYPNWLLFSTRNMSSNVGTWMWRTEREREVKLRRPRPAVLGAWCGARAQTGWIFSISREQKMRTPLFNWVNIKMTNRFECSGEFRVLLLGLGEYFPVSGGGVWPLARATITTFMNTMGTSPPAISHRPLSSLEITGWWWMRWDTPWWRTPSGSPCHMSSTKHRNMRKKR